MTRNKWLRISIAVSSFHTNLIKILKLQSDPITPHPATKISSTHLLYSPPPLLIQRELLFPSKILLNQLRIVFTFLLTIRLFQKTKKRSCCPSQKPGRFLTYYKRGLLAARQNLDCCLVSCCDIGTGPVGVPQPGGAGSVNASEEASLMGVGRLQRSQ